MSKRITILNLLGFSSILTAVFIGVATSGYLLFLSLWLAGIGIILLLINWGTSKIKAPRIRSALRWTPALAYIIFIAIQLINWYKYNAIIIPDNYHGTVSIIFGIEGYPELPASGILKQEINVPESGILITSTTQEELPNKFSQYYKNGERVLLDYESRMVMNDYPCIITDQVIRHYSFSPNQLDSSHQMLMASLCDSINMGLLHSRYSSEYDLIVETSKGGYLNLQSQNLYYLPSGIENLDVNQVILTGNHFTEIPAVVVKNKRIKELLIGHNPIHAIPADLNSIGHLERLSLNATEIKSYPSDMSALLNLKSIGLDDNNLDTIPHGISTIPNLTHLRVNNNNLKSFASLDSGFTKLEVLDIYSNRIASLGCEITNLQNLRVLNIWANEIDSIPDCISSLGSLEQIEIWDNPIRYVSPEIEKLQSLRRLQIDGDGLTEVQKAELISWLPDCEVVFQ